MNNFCLTLYSIIIHSGKFDNGHYFCIIKDFNDNCFYKINDSVISKIEKESVFNNYCGGYEYKFIGNKTNKFKIYNEENAYIFIFVNSNNIKKIFDYESVIEIFTLNKNKNTNIIEEKKISNINVIKKNNINNKESNANVNLIKDKIQKNKKYISKISSNKNNPIINIERFLENSINKSKSSLNIKPKSKYSDNDTKSFNNEIGRIKQNEAYKKNIYKYYKKFDLINKYKSQTNTEVNYELLLNINIPKKTEILKSKNLGYNKFKNDSNKNYLLFLLNSFGLFIRFLSDPNENIYKLICPQANNINYF